MDTIYTKSEQTEAKYTIGQAVSASKSRIAPYFLPLCLDAVRNRRYDEKITLMELNQISDEIISDSHFYGGNPYN